MKTKLQLKVIHWKKVKMYSITLICCQHLDHDDNDGKVNEDEDKDGRIINETMEMKVKEVKKDLDIDALVLKEYAMIEKLLQSRQKNKGGAVPNAE